ncbi:unnamed protein product [Amoebophrya sp. A120]|nr:unnamed protein product [Amoebophrya sp. A120]|eukprot:GSA120T00000227001.1
MTSGVSCDSLTGVQKCSCFANKFNEVCQATSGGYQAASTAWAAQKGSTGTCYLHNDSNYCAMAMYQIYHVCQEFSHGVSFSSIALAEVTKAQTDLQCLKTWPDTYSPPTAPAAFLATTQGGACEAAWKNFQGTCGAASMNPTWAAQNCLSSTACLSLASAALIDCVTSCEAQALPTYQSCYYAEMIHEDLLCTTKQAVTSINTNSLTTPPGAQNIDALVKMAMQGLFPYPTLDATVNVAPAGTTGAAVTKACYDAVADPNGYVVTALKTGEKPSVCGFLTNLKKIVTECDPIKQLSLLKYGTEATEALASINSQIQICERTNKTNEEIDETVIIVIVVVISVIAVLGITALVMHFSHGAHNTTQDLQTSHYELAQKTDELHAKTDDLHAKHDVLHEKIEK